MRWPSGKAVGSETAPVESAWFCFHLETEKIRTRAVAVTLFSETEGVNL